MDYCYDYISFLVFIFSYYHKNLLRKILSDDELSNDYELHMRLKILAKEFIENNVDNEDLDIEEITEIFLKSKIS